MFCNYLLHHLPHHEESSEVYGSEGSSDHNKPFYILNYTHGSNRREESSHSISSESSNESEYENLNDCGENLADNEISSYEIACRNNQENLWDERHDSRSNEGIVRDHKNIAYHIEECDTCIHDHHWALSSVSDENIGRERGDEVEEKNPDNDPHHIDTAISMYTRRHERRSRDDPRDEITGEVEKSWNPYTKEEKKREGVLDECLRGLRLEVRSWWMSMIFFCHFERNITRVEKFWFVPWSLFLESICENGKKGIEKYCSIHHPDFDDLHREGIESDHTVRYVSGLHDGEEYRIDLEEDHIQEEGETIGKRNVENMSDIGEIPSELHPMPSPCIPPSEDGHEKIACESCDHDERESLCMRRSPYETRKEYNHAQCKHLPESIGNNTELSLQYRLEITHERTIDETEESEYWCYRYADQSFSWIVSIETISSSHGKEKYQNSWECSQRENIGADLLNHFGIIVVVWEFTNSDRVESQISDDSKDREKIVNLRIESIACYIEIAREELDHEYRDQSGEDFATDLSNGIGVDFSSRHRI